MKSFLLFTLLLGLAPASFAECNYNQLLQAISRVNLEEVEDYREKGCDLKPADKLSVSSLELAVILEREEIVDYLIKEDSELIKLHGANALVAACSAKQQNKTAIELLVKKGVDINALSTHHYSCLYNAAVIPDVDFYQYLIGLGADPNRKVIPDPIYGEEKQISVADFIRQRSDDFLTLKNSLEKTPAATPKK